MTLNENMDLDLKEAMKQKDVKTLSVLRLIKSAIKNAEIAKGDVLTEEEVIGVIEKQAKQRRDSIEQYKRGNRNDLVETERGELLIIEKYLPTKLDETETKELVEIVISELGATGLKDMGNVIKEVRTRSKGAADGAVVSKIVKEYLA